MELVCALLLLMLGTSAAAPQDLSGKRFTFPEETDTDQVTVRLNHTELGALTVCMRVFTDLRRPHALFQLKTLFYHTQNTFVIKNHPDSSQYSVRYIQQKLVFNYKDNYIMNAWQSVCGTWDAVSGLAQIWVDGKHSSRKFLTNSRIKANSMSVILGQSSDSTQETSLPFGLAVRSRDSSFVGMLSDLHAWDYVLDPLEIGNYGLRQISARGNVLDWSRMDFKIHGRILVE